MHFELKETKEESQAPENADLKLQIQQMRDSDEAKALSKERVFGDESAAKELFEIAERKDSYYIAKIKEREARSRE